MKKFLVHSSQFVVILLFLLLPTTNSLLTTVYGQVDIGEVYGFGGVGSVGEAVRLIIVPIFSIAGVVMILYFIIGAFKYIISKGDKNLVDAARNQMTHAVIGFVILACIFFIMEYLAEYFGIPRII